MLSKLSSLIFIIFFSVSPVSASILRFDFSVDVDQFWDGLTYTDPDIIFDYSVFVDTSSPSDSTGTFPNGNPYASTFFSPSVMPKTQFTDEVLSEIDEPLDEPWNSTGIGREYSSTGFDTVPGTPETFEAIFLTTDSSSPMNNDQWTSYQRGLQRQMVIGSGNLVQTFSALEYQAYMESLIGDSNFMFGDYFIISEWFPDLEYSMTIYQYGYGGYATLTGVDPIPEPGTLILFGTGVAGLIGTRIRRKKK